MTFYETLEIAMKNRGIKASDICAKTGMNAAYFSKLKKLQLPPIRPRTQKSRPPDLRKCRVGV